MNLDVNDRNINILVAFAFYLSVFVLYLSVSVTIYKTIFNVVCASSHGSNGHDSLYDTKYRCTHKSIIYMDV